MEIPFEILSHGKGKILFSHANAYHPLMYRKFFEKLDIDNTILAPLHRPLWDREVVEADDWQIFTDDILRFAEAHELKGVPAIGHSLGAISLWKASILRPELFTSLILIDPVLISESIIDDMLQVDFSERHEIRPGIRTALFRRNHWQSRQEAHEHFIKKALFQKFDAQVFEDFIKYAIREDPFRGGYELAFPREWEARIYAGPENVWAFMDKTTVPILIIRAEHSNVISQESWKEVKKRVPHGQFLEMEDVGHLIPFEKPEQCAELISPFVDEFF